jgi:hypothetical protein
MQHGIFGGGHDFFGRRLADELSIDRWCLGYDRASLNSFYASNSTGWRISPRHCASSLLSTGFMKKALMPSSFERWLVMSQV